MPSPRQLRRWLSDFQAQHAPCGAPACNASEPSLAGLKALLQLSAFQIAISIRLVTGCNSGGSGALPTACPVQGRVSTDRLLTVQTEALHLLGRLLSRPSLLLSTPNPSLLAPAAALSVPQPARAAAAAAHAPCRAPCGAPLRGRATPPPSNLVPSWPAMAEPQLPRLRGSLWFWPKPTKNTPPLTGNLCAAPRPAFARAAVFLGPREGYNFRNKGRRLADWRRAAPVCGLRGCIYAVQTKHPPRHSPAGRPAHAC